MVATRIYVACLASYNAGRLHGVYIDDLDMFDGDEVHERVQAMLATSPVEGAEEWAIHDHEGFGAYRVEESHSFEELCQVAKLIAEHGSEVASHALEHVELARASDYIADSYQGQHRSLADWAEQWLEDTGMMQEVPEWARYYIDTSAWARDANYNGEVYAVDSSHGGVHVFYS